MESLEDNLLVLLSKITAKLPFWVVYRIADIFYFLLYYVFKYRRQIVHENLVRSFPEKSPEEISQITRKFYHHLSDLGLETIKYHGMTEKQIDDRLKVHNLDIFEEYYNQGKSIIVLGIHYNNWEWSSSMQRNLKAQFLMVYNSTVNHKKMERFLLDTRERFGALSVPTQQTFRIAFEFTRSERPGGLMLVADQTGPAHSQFWTTFLNQETAFFTGPMKIAIKTNQPVIMHHTRRVGRGRYEVFHYKLVENPSDVQPEEILMKYLTKLEEIIREEPAYWLWSHRRWKHKRSANIKLHERTR
jgi:KDO2-lipid IV(A) lauroyltransferase